MSTHEPIAAADETAYPAQPGTFDEVFGPAGDPREPMGALVAELGRLGPERMIAAGIDLGRVARDEDSHVVTDPHPRAPGQRG